MNFDYLLLNSKLEKNLLLKYGFKLKNDCFYLEKPLNDDFKAKIKILSHSFDIELFDVNFNTDYEMLNIESLQSGFIKSLRQQIDALANDIKNKCFISTSIKDQVIDYINKKYGVTCEHPWQKYPNFCTFKKEKNQKWFALIMDIPLDKLGFKQSYMVDVINLKADPEYIQQIIDHKNIFPAYHMNKIHWYTVLLNNDLQQEKLQNLIDISFNSV